MFVLAFFMHSCRTLSCSKHFKFTPTPPTLREDEKYSTTVMYCKVPPQSQS